jgi:hypothetical protein
MLRVKIIKNGQITHLGQFNTQSEADAWITEGSKQQWWGKPAYTEVIQPRMTEQQEVVITPEVRDEDGNIITPAVTETQEVVVSPETTIEHLAEFEVQIEDITAEIEAQRKLEIRKQKRLFGEHMIDQISVLNEQANIDELALEALLTDSDFTVIREHLYAGSLKSAYNKILSVEPKILTVFSQADLNAIKAKLLVKLQELDEI